MPRIFYYFCFCHKDKSSTDIDAIDAFGTLKSLLTHQILLAEQNKSDDGFVPSGCIHVINTRPGEGLVWNTLAKNQVIEEIFSMKSEGLKASFLFKVGS